MEILGVGPFEFILFLVIALLVLGPERMISTSRGVARFIRNIIASPTWRTVQNVQQEMRELPTHLLREAGLEHPEELLPSAEEIAHEAGFDDVKRQVNQIKSELSNWSISDAPTIQPPAPRPAPPPKSVPMTNNKPEAQRPTDSGAPSIAPASAPTVSQTSTSSSTNQ
jgi:Sec-independent protein translocase protein TatA